MAVTPRYLKSRTQGENNPKVEWMLVAASQTINKGDLVQVNATTKLLEVAAAASTTIVGIADASITTGGSVTSADIIPVIWAYDAVLLVNYTPGTKTSLTQADLYTVAFDLASKTSINLDDTTGGMWEVVAYDNTAATAEVVLKRANYFLA